MTLALTKATLGSVVDGLLGNKYSAGGEKSPEARIFIPKMSVNGMDVPWVKYTHPENVHLLVCVGNVTGRGASVGLPVNFLEGLAAAHNLARLCGISSRQIHLIVSVETGMRLEVASSSRFREAIYRNAAKQIFAAQQWREFTGSEMNIVTDSELLAGSYGATIRTLVKNYATDLVSYLVAQLEFLGAAICRIRDENPLAEFVKISPSMFEDPRQLVPRVVERLTIRNVGRQGADEAAFDFQSRPILEELFGRPTLACIYKRLCRGPLVRVNGRLQSLPFGNLNSISPGHEGLRVPLDPEFDFAQLQVLFPHLGEGHDLELNEVRAFGRQIKSAFRCTQIIEMAIPGLFNDPPNAVDALEAARQERKESRAETVETLVKYQDPMAQIVRSRYRDLIPAFSANQAEIESIAQSMQSVAA